MNLHKVSDWHFEILEQLQCFLPLHLCITKIYFRTFGSYWITHSWITGSWKIPTVLCWPKNVWMCVCAGFFLCTSCQIGRSMCDCNAHFLIMTDTSEHKKSKTSLKFCNQYLCFVRMGARLIRQFTVFTFGLEWKKSIGGGRNRCTIKMRAMQFVKWQRKKKSFARTKRATRQQRKREKPDFIDRWFYFLPIFASVMDRLWNKLPGNCDRSTGMKNRKRKPSLSCRLF